MDARISSFQNHYSSNKFCCENIFVVLFVYFFTHFVRLNAAYNFNFF